VSRKSDSLALYHPIIYHFVEVKPLSSSFFRNHESDLIFGCDYHDDHPRAQAILREIFHFKEQKKAGAGITKAA
jgi:hypothetical protein